MYVPDDMGGGFLDGECCWGGLDVVDVEWDESICYPEIAYQTSFKS